MNSIPSIGYCQESNVGLQVSLKGIIDALRNPQAGISSYDGVQSVEWDNGEQYHRFHV